MIRSFCVFKQLLNKIIEYGLLKYLLLSINSSQNNKWKLSVWKEKNVNVCNPSCPLCYVKKKPLLPLMLIKSDFCGR